MFLEQVELFKGIDTHIILEISDTAEEADFPKGIALFQKGDFAEYLYILVNGTVDLTIEGQESISFPVNKPGDVFGWSALVEPHLYTAMAETAAESRLIKIKGEYLMDIFRRYPSEALTVMKRLAKMVAARPVGKFTLRFQEKP